MLKSLEFLPEGGALGFGLAHLYPVTFNSELKDMIKYLKGEDAHVYSILPSAWFTMTTSLAGTGCAYPLNLVGSCSKR